MRPELSHVVTPARRLPWYRRRWVLLLAFSPVVPLGAGAVALIVLTSSADREHRRAVAETDKLGPRWRLAEIEADRETPTDAENAAVVVRRALAWRAGQPVYPHPRRPDAEKPLRPVHASEEVDRLPIGTRPGPELFEEFAGELEPYAGTLVAARELVGMRRGRTVLKIPADPLTLMLPHIQDGRQLATLLQDEALLRAMQGDVDAAILSTRAILGVAASIGDEPFAISMLVRIAEDAVAVRAAARALGLGVAGDEALAGLDADLADEEARPLLRVALRGERGASYAILGWVADGSTAGFVPGFPATSPAMNLLGWAAKRGPHVRAWYRYNQGVSLRQMNEALAIAERPGAEQPPLWTAWEKKLRGPGSQWESLSIAPSQYVTTFARNVADAHLGHLATMRVGRAMIALERHRLARGAWAAEGELAMPVDPFDGKPLRRKRTPGGWTIYSVGGDRVDDGGEIERKSGEPPQPKDVGVRLLDPEARRQPPPPEDRP